MEYRANKICIVRRAANDFYCDSSPNIEEDDSLFEGSDGGDARSDFTKEEPRRSDKTNKPTVDQTVAEEASERATGRELPPPASPPPRPSRPAPSRPEVDESAATTTAAKKPSSATKKEPKKTKAAAKPKAKSSKVEKAGAKSAEGKTKKSSAAVAAAAALSRQPARLRKITGVSHDPDPEDRIPFPCTLNFYCA